MRYPFARISSLLGVFALTLALGACGDQFATAPSAKAIDEAPAAPCQDAGCPIAADDSIDASSFVGRVEDAINKLSYISWSNKADVIADLNKVKDGLVKRDTEYAVAQMAEPLSQVREHHRTLGEHTNYHMASQLSEVIALLEDVAAGLGMDVP